MLESSGGRREQAIGVLYFRLETCTDSHTNDDTNGVGCEDKIQVYLITLGVLPSFRKLGLGSALLNWTLQYCREEWFERYNVCRLRLHVQTSNLAAFVFYTEKHGLRVIERIEDYYTKVECRSAYLLEYSFVNVEDD